MIILEAYDTNLVVYVLVLEEDSDFASLNILVQKQNMLNVDSQLLY